MTSARPRSRTAIHAREFSHLAQVASTRTLLVLLTDTWGCLHFRTVPQEHRLINKDWPRRARNYNEENQTRSLLSTRSVITKELYSLMFLLYNFKQCAFTFKFIINILQYHMQG